MKKRNTILFSILLMMLLFSTHTMQAFAMESNFQLPVEIVLEGDRPVHPETFVIQMRALTKDAPMPKGAKDPIVTMEIQGKGVQSFPVITYKKPGVYRYEITQKKGTSKEYTYDPSIYNVTVYCTADSKGLETTVVALEQGKEEVKKEAVRFVNRYKVQEKPVDTEKPEKPAKTGDEKPVQMLLLILIISGCVILFVGWKKYKDRKKNSET